VSDSPSDTETGTGTDAGGDGDGGVDSDTGDAPGGDAGYTVVVTDHDFADLSIEREVLDGVARVVELSDSVDGGPDAAAVRDALAGADAVLNLRRELDAEDVAALADAAVVARYGIGVDNVAVEAAAERGIPVTNVPDYCLEEVATHALALLLASDRGVATYDADVAAGGWSRTAGPEMHRLSTRTAGVVGFGAIGRALGERLHALGLAVLASDPYLTDEDVPDWAALVPFEDLLERSHYVSVHSPLTEATRGMFDADAFARMRPDARLVNVARGPIVDADALLDALDAGAIAGAALDVLPEEPPAEDHPVRTHPDVVVTPHVAWYSEEANAERRRTAAGIVRSALLGQAIENVTNGV
jgi:D-3-phosphoglycerate dehydrogenase